MESARSHPSLVVTAFEPFDGASTNPTMAALEALAADFHAHPLAYHGYSLTAEVLPVQFHAVKNRAKHLVTQALWPEVNASPADHPPEGGQAAPDWAGTSAVLVGLGLAANRTGITPERVAINVADARIPDNAGAQPVDEPLVAGGAAAYFSTLPLKAMTRAVRQLELDAAVSNSAGTYVCNALFYHLMHEVACIEQVGHRPAGVVGRRPAGVAPPTRAGFVHVPATEHMPQADINRAVIVAVRTACMYAVEAKPDVRESGGAES